MDKEALKLQTAITFWYQHEPTKDNFNESLLPIGTAGSVESFWHFYQHFRRPSSLPDNSYLYAFNHDVKPVWEDPRNSHGGSFILRFHKQHADKVWEDMLLGLVARSLQEDSMVNGLRLKSRKSQAVIEVWVSDVSDEAELEKVRDWILDTLCLNPDTSIEMIKFHVE